MKLSTELKFKLLCKDKEAPKSTILTRIPGIDNYTDGLREGGTYLFSGLEKSGKSTFLINLAANTLYDKVPTAIIATELTVADYAATLAKIVTSTTKNESAVKRVLNEVQIIAPDTTDPKYRITDTSGLFDADLICRQITRLAEEGVKLIIVDNLTTLKNQSDTDWKAIAKAAQTIINLNRKLQVTIIVVVHFNDKGLNYNEKPEKIRHLLAEGQADDIFIEPGTVILRPTTADIYGGGGIKSQFDGVFLFWRPFQKFDSPDLKKKTAVIVDSFRGDPTKQVNSLTRLDFDPEGEVYYELGKKPYLSQFDQFTQTVMEVLA